MSRSDLLKQLELYSQGVLITQEEKPFYERFVSFINANPNCFERANRGHITGAAWIVNYDGSQALLTHHKKLNIWVQLGGHADGDADIKRVALKEAQEESGIEHLKFVIPTIFDIDIHTIPGPCEYHYDVRYLLQAPEGAKVIVSDESHDLLWVAMNKIQDYAKERSVIRLAEKYTNMKCK